MIRPLLRFFHLWRDASGATAIEYALIVLLISLAIVAAAAAVGSALNLPLLTAGDAITAR